MIYNYPTPELTKVITAVRHDPDTDAVEIYYRNYFGGSYWLRETMTAEDVTKLAEAGDKSAFFYRYAKSKVNFGHPDRTCKAISPR
jgi:hypothetical protein